MHFNEIGVTSVADDDKTGEPATGDPKIGETPKRPATGTGTPATGGTDSTSTASDDELTPEKYSELLESNKKMADALKKANKEAQDRRKELEAAATAKLTDEEQRAKQLKDLEEANEKATVELAELRLEQAVNRLAGTLGIVDPETVTRLIDWADIEFDNDGKATNLEAVVKELLGRKPFLAGKPAAPAAAARTGNNAADGTGGEGPKPNLTADELKVAADTGMDPSRYAALKNVKTLDDYLKTRPKPS